MMALIRSPLAWLLLLFVAPLLIAALMLQQGWYHAGRSAGGEWMAESAPRLSLATPRWSLAYRSEGPCLSHCQHALNFAERVIRSVGRLNQHVGLSLLSTEPIEQPVRLPLQLSVSEHYQGLSQHYLYLADPSGLLLLRYPFSGDPAQDRLYARYMLSDLKRLLKANAREGR